MALLKNPVLWCRASAFLAHEYARFDKTDLESISASILKVYNRLGEQTRLAANDVPALLERAKNLKSAAQIIEKLGAFRGDELFSYPLGEDVPVT